MSLPCRIFKKHAIGIQHIISQTELKEEAKIYILIYKTVIESADSDRVSMADDRFIAIIDYSVMIDIGITGIAGPRFLSLIHI